MAVKRSKKNKNNISDNLESAKTKKLVIIILIILLSISLIYLLLPKIILTGNKHMIINYYEKYNEPGYKGIFLFKDITNKVNTTNNIEDNKVGEYTVNYNLKFKSINFKKTRKVSIIDNVKADIVSDTSIKVCPNKEVEYTNYKAIDEYDGDITNRVVSTIFEDKIVLSVSDTSNNLTTKEISMTKIDKEAPKLTLKGNNPMYLNKGSTYTEPGYTAIDNCDDDITDKVTVTGSVGTNLGTYELTYTITDSSGNTTELKRKVTVRNTYLYNNGSIGNGTIYLTFDDGPNQGTTNIILDILKEEGVKATFFVTCKGPDSLIKRIYDEGHTLALHTCTHTYSSVYSSVDNYFNDLERISNRVKNLTGYESKIIRFPGGSSNTVSRNYSRGIMTTLAGMVLDRGYRYYDWNVDSNDAGGANTSSRVYSNVVNSLSHSRSNMVLMHDIKPQTRDALRNIIRYGKEHGYTFKQIDMSTYMIRHGINN